MPAKLLATIPGHHRIMQISAATLLTAQQVRPQTPARSPAAAAKPFSPQSFDSLMGESAPAPQSAAALAEPAPPRPAARGMGTLLDITV